MNRFIRNISPVSYGIIVTIAGTDLVRALAFRFEAFWRPVVNMKKFGEGTFSDLRSLKPGVDAFLEEPKVSAVLIVRWFIISSTLVVISGLSFRVLLHTHSEEAKGILLVCAPSLFADSLITVQRVVSPS
jgi:hypothetical protein